MTGVRLTALGNVMRGTEGDDTILSPDGVTTIYGRCGNDIIRAVGGTYVDGGDGNDQISISAWANGEAHGGAGDDSITVSDNNSFLSNLTDRTVRRFAQGKI